jgi:hypothetical protein
VKLKTTICLNLPTYLVVHTPKILHKYFQTFYWLIMAREWSLSKHLRCFRVKRVICKWCVFCWNDYEWIALSQLLASLQVQVEVVSFQAMPPTHPGITDHWIVKRGPLPKIEIHDDSPYIHLMQLCWEKEPAKSPSLITLKVQIRNF